MIITGKFYQSTPQTTDSTTSSSNSKATVNVDSTDALKSFFQDETAANGFSDSVQISAKALSVLNAYANKNTDSTSGASDPTADVEDPLMTYIQQRAKQAYLNGQANPSTGTLAEMSNYMNAYSDRQVSDIYQQIKDANQQMSDDFIVNASRYGVQNLL